MNSYSDNIILLSFGLNEVRNTSFMRVHQPKDKNDFFNRLLAIVSKYKSRLSERTQFQHIFKLVFAGESHG